MSDTDVAASFLDPVSNGDESDVDSLPSEPDSDDVTVSEEDYESDAEREWKESLQQLELLLSMVIVPYIGKYFGRKFAFWGMLEQEVVREYMLISDRLETVHGMELSGRDCGHEQGSFSRYWTSGSCSSVMKEHQSTPCVGG